MKKYLFIILIIVMVTGCVKVSYLDTELTVTDTLVLDASVEVLFRQDEHGSRRMISYIEHSEEVLISENGPSHPEINSAGKQLAFIDNAYWEAIGQVMLFDLESGLRTIEHDIDQYTPKDLEWLDEDRLLVVIGYAYGTVSVGGDLYLLDADTQEFEMVYQAKDHEEVISSFVTSENVILRIARFNDDYTEYAVYEHILDLK